MSDADRVVIIGGGVIGLASAHFLNRAGRPVTVVDQGEIGQGCSHANCGFVSPSHVLPLCQPGAVSGALKSMFTPNSPFYIKPRFSPSLWWWLLRFARRCNQRDMLAAGSARHALLESSRRLYEELITQIPLDCEWQTRGLLFIYRDHDNWEAFAKTNDLLSERFDCPARRYDADEIYELEPALKPGLAGGWHYEQDAHLRPDRLMQSWREHLASAGVEFQEHCRLQEFTADTNRAAAVQTSGGELAAGTFVVATGAWTPQLNRELGCRIPIQPGKGYSITMARPQICPQIPMISPECKVAVTPMISGYRLGSTMEFSGYDDRLNRKRLALLTQGASTFLQEPACEPIEEEWFGWRPMTSDGIPYLGRTPGYENVYVAAGHNMLGLSMAPATGKLLSELILGETPHIDPAPYALGRR